MNKKGEDGLFLPKCTFFFRKGVKKGVKPAFDSFGEFKKDYDLF